MLTFISDKFSQRLTEPLHEPRAAMFVNRFTRTATIMYATSGVTEILGVSPNQLISKSFFYCIQERCLRDAVRCLESAKANDSIAYLRFWFRNPLQDENPYLAGYGSGPYMDPIPPVELEAVVSCTSDGLVVILRRARAPVPLNNLPPQPVPVYSNGLFAAPWALEPVFSYGATSHSHQTTMPSVAHPEAEATLCREGISQASSSGSPHTPSSSAYSYGFPPFYTEAKASGSSGPQSHNLMDTIRDVAVFAWGIVGINRSLEKYKCGTPTGDSQPVDTIVEDSWGNEAAAGRSWE